MQLYQHSATELSKLLSDKQISATELCRSVLSRIEETEPAIHAYLTVTGDTALAQAKAVDEKRAKGEEISPLAGIPVGIKDNICQKNIPTTCASKMLENFVPPYDATVIERLRAQDVVFTGKLNMDEFAMGSTCETSYFGATKNPRNIAHSPGGSSGGSAAAVAAGSAVLSLGSDTGGSVRGPASWCGLVGLKPTYGAVSRYGAVAMASSLDQIGPIGRTVSDVALLSNAIFGADERDATSARREHPDFTKCLDKGVKGLVIGVPKEYYGEGVSEEVRTSVLAAVESLRLAGAAVKELSLPSTHDALAAYYIISCAEASSNLARFDGVKYGYRTPKFDGLNDLYERTRSEGFGDEVKRRILLGTFVLSSGFFDAYYNRAKKLQQKIRREFEEAFAGCDLLITPTSPFPAFKLGENSANPVADYAADLCTVTVNIATLPAMSIPCGFAANGLPIGMQLIGSRFGEDKLFAVAAHYERLCGGFCGVADIR